MFNQPLLGIALRLHARKLNDPKALEAVKAALRPGHRARAFAAIEDFAGDKASPEFLCAMAAATPEAIGDGTILEQLLAFLNEHWDEILAMLLKWLGM